MNTVDASFWNRIAQDYAAKPVDDPEAFDRKIAITREQMTPEHVVLDIGCGTGSLALRLAPSAAEVHGLDLSEEMIRIARGKAVDQELGNVRFHVGPFDEGFDAFAPGSLDGLCAYSILHLLPDRRAALGRIFELLKPGGFFVSSTACLGDSWIPYAPILTVMRWAGKAPPVWVFRREHLAGEIRDAGFIDLEFPDVGSEPTTAFAVARKPDPREP